MTTRIKDDEIAVQVDSSSATQILVGTAKVGTATSAAAWQIKRLDITGTTAVAVKYANGSVEFNATWDNRSSYTYS